MTMNALPSPAELADVVNSSANGRVKDAAQIFGVSQPAVSQKLRRAGYRKVGKTWKVAALPEHYDIIVSEITAMRQLCEAVSTWFDTGVGVQYPKTVFDALFAYRKFSYP